MPNLGYKVSELILVEVFGIHLKGHAVLKDFADVLPLSVIVKDADGVASRFQLFVGDAELTFPIVASVHTSLNPVGLLDVEFVGILIILIRPIGSGISDGVGIAELFLLLILLTIQR